MEKMPVLLFAVVLLLVESLFCKRAGWKKAQAAFFGDGGAFEQIHAVAKSK
jgi:ABC-type sulfate transport system substrate-binding protein